MNYSAIAVRYAKALFALANEKNLLQEIQEDIKYLYSVCQSEAQFIRLLEYPVIPASKKTEIFNRIFSDKIRKETLLFLELIAQKRREPYLPSMAHYFLHLYKEKSGIKTVTFTSVSPISDNARKNIAEVLKKYYKADIELIEQTNENLIGGYILRVDDEQYDASVLNQLQKIKREFIK